MGQTESDTTEPAKHNAEVQGSFWNAGHDLFSEGMVGT